jgi:DNA-binding response OmpR family regulator/anti-anti-sigma regulatory factor
MAAIVVFSSGVPRVLVSNNSAVLRHLSAAAFRRLALQVLVVADGREALEAARLEQPALVILDAELDGISGYEVSRRIKEEQLCAARVVLVMGRRLNADTMRRVASAACDEVLIAPMSADELYDVVAILLGMPRRGSERFSIDLAVASDDGVRTVDGRVTNLSVDGARLLLPLPVEDGAALKLTISRDDGEHEPVTVSARVVWVQPHESGCVAGAMFEHLDDLARMRLARLTQWEIVEDTERTRVVLKGDFTEASNFRDLLPAMIGKVDFDLSQVGYMNSLGVREWVNFLRKAAIQGYEFHACSVPFVLQAALARDVLGRGTVASFFAPYHCDTCDHQEERLLQSATVLALEAEAPSFSCPACGGALVLDEHPERYLAFLRDGRGEPGSD